MPEEFCAPAHAHRVWPLHDSLLMALKVTERADSILSFNFKMKEVFYEFHMWDL